MGEMEFGLWERLRYDVETLRSPGEGNEIRNEMK